LFIYLERTHAPAPALRRRAPLTPTLVVLVDSAQNPPVEFRAITFDSDREVAVDMLPCADAAPVWPALLVVTTTATLILPGQTVLPDGARWHSSTSLAHAEKKSETAWSRVTDESVRVTPRVPYRSHTSINSLWPSLKRCLNPESSDFRLGRCRPLYLRAKCWTGPRAFVGVCTGAQGVRNELL